MMGVRRLVLITALSIALSISLTLKAIFTVSETAGEIALFVNSVVIVYIVVAAVRRLRQRLH